MTADEVAALEKGENPLGGENGTPTTKKSEPHATSGSKRKAGAIDNQTPVKKSKISSESAEEDDDDDGEEDLS